MKRFMSVLLAMLMVASFVTSGILAAGNDKDNDKTMLFLKGEENQAPFKGNKIQLIIDGVSYNFSPSGAKWVSDATVPELNIPTDGSLEAMIVDSVTGSFYTVTLVNHSN